MFKLIKKAKKKAGWGKFKPTDCDKKNLTMPAIKNGEYKNTETGTRKARIKGLDHCTKICSDPVVGDTGGCINACRGQNVNASALCNWNNGSSVYKEKLEKKQKEEAASKKKTKAKQLTEADAEKKLQILIAKANKLKLKKKQDEEDIKYYLGALDEEVRGVPERKRNYTNNKKIERGRKKRDLIGNFEIEMRGVSSMFGKYAWYQDKTSEPIPDYIMRALKPKKSVHPEYGKLRY